jgi:hypothetical protein
LLPFPVFRESFQKMIAFDITVIIGFWYIRWVKVNKVGLVELIVKIKNALIKTRIILAVVEY